MPQIWSAFNPLVDMVYPSDKRTYLFTYEQCEVGKEKVGVSLDNLDWYSIRSFIRNTFSFRYQQDVESTNDTNIAKSILISRSIDNPEDCVRLSFRVCLDSKPRLLEMDNNGNKSYLKETLVNDCDFVVEIFKKLFIFEDIDSDHFTK